MSKELESTIKKKVSKKAKPKPPETSKHLSTGCTLTDLVLGGGAGMGFALKKVHNVVGDSSSGKTFLAMETIAANHYQSPKHFKWNFDDGEEGNTFDTKKLYGFEAVREDVDLKSKTVEEFDVNVRRFVRKKCHRPTSHGAYFIDSLDGLSDADKEERADERYKQAEAGKDVKDAGTYGVATPKFLSQEFFKTKTSEFAQSNASLIIVSQVRENINAGLFGKKLKRNGGKALDFYAHTVCWLATIKKIKKKDCNGVEQHVGTITELKTTKSKTPRPYRSCRFIFFFDYGIDNIGTNLHYLYDVWGEDGKLKKSAQSIPWGGTQALNLKSAKAFLEENGILDDAKEDHREEFGKRNLKLDRIKEWMEEHDLFEKWKEVFGTPRSYDELRLEIANDPKLAKQLEQLVIDKWEAGEASIKTTIPRKYS